MVNTPDTLSGKTFPERSPATKAGTSSQYSKSSRKLPTPTFMCLNLKNEGGTNLLGDMQEASWEMDGASLGERLMLNTGEYPNVVVESTLSQILVPNAPEKYYLSARACQGILNRAERRGKKLPPMLEEALMEVCGDWLSFHLQQDPISDKVISPCIGGQPQATVGVASFMGGQGSKARSIAYCDDGTTPTIKSVMSGGNTIPDVVYGIEGDGNVRSQICENMSPTMKTIHPNCVAINKTSKSRKYIIRRLTPLECCRLQGFPDYWMDGVEGSDSAKYKMWGNGMALPNMLHVMQGIVIMENQSERS